MYCIALLALSQSQFKETSHQTQLKKKLIWELYAVNMWKVLCI